MFGLSILAIIGLAGIVGYAYMTWVAWQAASLVSPPKSWFAKAMWSLAWPVTVYSLIKQVFKSPPPDLDWL